MASTRAGYLTRERPDHSLAPTALVQEAYLRLVEQRSVQWHNRAHFFAIAAHVMRRLLVDQARIHGASKRRAGHRVPLPDIDVGVNPEDLDVIALDAALVRLAAIDRRQSRLVERRFFEGLTGDETPPCSEYELFRDGTLRHGTTTTRLRRRPPGRSREPHSASHYTQMHPGVFARGRRHRRLADSDRTAFGETPTASVPTADSFSTLA